MGAQRRRFRVEAAAFPDMCTEQRDPHRPGKRGKTLRDQVCIICAHRGRNTSSRIDLEPLQRLRRALAHCTRRSSSPGCRQLSTSVHRARRLMRLSRRDVCVPAVRMHRHRRPRARTRRFEALAATISHQGRMRTEQCDPRRRGKTFREPVCIRQQPVHCARTNVPCIWCRARETSAARPWALYWTRLAPWLQTASHTCAARSTSVVPVETRCPCARHPSTSLLSPCDHRGRTEALAVSSRRLLRLSVRGTCARPAHTGEDKWFGRQAFAYLVATPVRTPRLSSLGVRSRRCETICFTHSCS